MKRTTILLLATGLLAGGCSEQGAESYSSELSQEVKKPRPDGPDFGAYQRTAPAPGQGAAEPKRLEKGKG